MNIKIKISTLKILHLNFFKSFDLNLEFQFQINILEFQNLYFQSENYQLNLKIDILILNIFI
jgi:hypothetical protein